MNIKEFNEGDVITRNEAMVYAHNGCADGSFTGDKMTLVGVDESAKVIVLLDDESKPFTLSYARDRWEEGWALFPTSLLEKAANFIKSV